MHIPLLIVYTLGNFRLDSKVLTQGKSRLDIHKRCMEVEITNLSSSIECNNELD